MIFNDKVKQIIKQYDGSLKDYDSLEFIRNIQDENILEELLWYSKISEPLFKIESDKAKFSRFASRGDIDDITKYVEFNKFNDRYFNLRLALADNKYLPSRLVDILIEDMNPFVMLECINREDISEENLKKIATTLSNSKFWYDFIQFRFSYNPYYKILNHKNFNDASIIEGDSLISEYLRNLIVPNYKTFLNVDSRKIYIELHKKLKFKIPKYDNYDDWFVVSKILETNGKLSKKEIYNLYDRIKQIPLEKEWEKHRENISAFFNLIDNSIIPAEIYDDFADFVLKILKGRNSNGKKFYTQLFGLHPYTSTEKIDKILSYSRLEIDTCEFAEVLLSMVNNKLQRIEPINSVFKSDCAFVNTAIKNLIFKEDLFLKLNESQQERVLDAIGKRWFYNEDANQYWVHKYISKESFPASILEKISERCNDPFLELILLDHPNSTQKVYENIYKSSDVLIKDPSTNKPEDYECKYIKMKAKQMMDLKDKENDNVIKKVKKLQK